MARNWRQPRESMWGSAPGSSFEWNFTIGTSTVIGGLVAVIAGVLLGLPLLLMLAIGTGLGCYLANRVTGSRTRIEPELRPAADLTRRPEASDLVMEWLETLSAPDGTVRLGEHLKYRTILTHEGVESRTRFRTISTPWSQVADVTALSEQQRGVVISRGEGFTFRVKVSAETGRSHAVFVSDDIVDDVVAVCRIKARDARDAV